MFVYAGTEEKKKKKKECGGRRRGREVGRQGEGGGLACLIQCPVVVTCPSAQSIGRKSGREGERDVEEERIEIQPFLTTLTAT